MSAPEGRSADHFIPRRSRRRSLPTRPSLLLRLFERWLSGAEPPGSHPDPLQTASDEAAAELVDQAEAFATLRVSDVMTPRADIAAIELSTALPEVVARFVEIEHSRMPVYRETLDDPVGVIHLKDLFKLIAPPSTTADAPPAPSRRSGLRAIRRELLYVPASMRASDLLVKMRAARIHMALVIDEFGGTDGLVTLEDLLEAVVGEIDDEHDEASEAQIVPRPGGLFDADARAPVEVLETLVGEPLADPDDEEEVETLAGLVASLAGRVPQRGEVIPHPKGYEFEVVDADPRRIRRLRIRAPDQLAARSIEATAPLPLAQRGTEEGAA